MIDLLNQPFWIRLARLAGEPDSGERSLWDRLRAKLDLALHRPEAVPDVIASEFVGRGGPYSILKSPSEKTYSRPGERGSFLWVQMDGNRRIKDLVSAYFVQYGSFADGRVARLVSEPKAGYFLTDRPVNGYRQAQGQLQSRRPASTLMRATGAVMQHRFAIGGLHRLLGVLYLWGIVCCSLFPCRSCISYRPAHDIYRFCGRGVCEEHARTLLYILELFGKEKGPLQALVVADSLCAAFVDPTRIRSSYQN